MQVLNQCKSECILWMVLHGFSSKTKQNLCGVSQVFLRGFRINSSSSCRVRVYDIENWLCRLASPLLNKLWSTIQLLNVQKLSPLQPSTGKISNCYGRMDMGRTSWYLNYAWHKNCIRRKTTKFIACIGHTFWKMCWFIGLWKFIHLLYKFEGFLLHR